MRLKAATLETMRLRPPRAAVRTHSSMKASAPSLWKVRSRLVWK